MQVLYIGYPLQETGAPHQAMAILHLTRQGVQTRFVAWGNSTPPSWLVSYTSLKYELFLKHGLLSGLRLLLGIFRIFKQNRPDCVYVQGAQQTPFLLWLPFLKGKTSLLYHTQDYLEPGKHKFYKCCERFFAQRADWVISNEVNRARFMASSYRLKQMPKVIRTALPSWWKVPERDETYRQQLLAEAGLASVEQPRLIVAGEAYRQDRMGSELLQAFARLPSNYALVFSWMAPGIPSRLACETQMRETGIEEKVIFLDALDFPSLLRIYACCDIGMLLYPNSSIGHFYQAPGRLTEYLRCGLPIVASNFPGLELLILKHSLGAVANPYEPTAIANAIDETGRMSDTELAATRSHLITLAETKLAYEKDADTVFGNLFY